MKKMFKMFSVALLLAVPGTVMATSGASAHCVRGVANWDVLWIRSGPNRNAAKVGAIPPRACGVSVNYNRCRGSWCRVSYRGIRGWSHTRYLTAGGGGGPVMRKCRPKVAAFAEGRLRPFVRAKALIRWTRKVQRRHGFRFANWARAKNRSSRCKRAFSGSFWVCRVRANPCRR